MEATSTHNPGDKKNGAGNPASASSSTPNSAAAKSVGTGTNAGAGMPSGQQAGTGSHTTRWQDFAAKAKSKFSSGKTPAQEQFQRDLSAFVSDVESLLGRGDALTSEAMQAAKEQLGKRTQEIKAQLNELGEQASQTTNHTLEVAQEYVRERPLASVGVALGVGAVVGLLLGSRR